MTKFSYFLILLGLNAAFFGCERKLRRSDYSEKTNDIQTQSLLTNNTWKFHEKFSDQTVSLNGTWEIAQGSASRIPEHFSHHVPVPGLISEAEPSFDSVGLLSAERTHFWYRKSFIVEGSIHNNVFLKIYKAKYGTKVFVNGQPVGENTLNFTPSVFNITSSLNPPDSSNELLIRIGAHIDALPDTVSTGGEVEKLRYMPGIYDYVELIYTNNIYYRSVQTAPDPENNSVMVEARIANTGKQVSTDLQAFIYESDDENDLKGRAYQKVIISENGVVSAKFPVKITGVHLWTPEDPFLYTLILNTGGQIYRSRFGMRSFRLDSSFTNRAMLNGCPYYFRGTNIALFRFFEDPACKGQPWDPRWVRKLFRTFKSLGMNSARTTICSFPKFWYEIADEEGFALFAEYPIWYALKEGVSRADFDKERNDPQRRYGIYPEKLTADRLINEYTQWMEDLWNHASVIAWDAQNETWTQFTGEAIQQVRMLDLSRRPWDNGWSPPRDPADFREAHQYFAGYHAGSETKNAGLNVNKPFTLSNLPGKEKIPNTFYMPYQNAYHLPVNGYTDQPCILNEYGYLWLNRDGTPTSLTKPYYDAVLGPEATVTERREYYAYMLGALTEYWRSVRTCFGVLHVFGLAGSLPPKGATCDNFIDIDNLELDPHFKKTMISACSPVGICIEAWNDQYKKGQAIDIPIMITNDLKDSVVTSFILKLTVDERVTETKNQKVMIAPWQQIRYYKRLHIPGNGRKGEITAILIRENNLEVKSIRRFTIN